MDGFLNALIVFANFVFIPGLAYGAQLALGALGVTLVYGILRFSNFAHGDLMAFGTMITILVTWWLTGMGVTLGPLPTALLALPVGILGAVAVALLIDRSVFRFYRQQKSAGIVFVMASVGVMFVLNGVVRLIIGPNEQRFADGERFLVTVRGFKEWSGLAEGLAIRIPVAITLIWFLQYSKTGKAMRAYSDNEDLALLSGINPDRVVMVTWIIAASLATIAGVLYGLDKSFRPFTYFQLLLPIFAAAIVGGIGQPLGAIAGGFVVAFSEVTLTYAYKRVLEYLGFAPDGLIQLLSTEYKFAISFVILVLVLLVRPTGIFKGRVL
jgi:branched-chain amino acid transport system permease protein